MISVTFCVKVKEVKDFNQLASHSTIQDRRRLRNKLKVKFMLTICQSVDVKAGRLSSNFDFFHQPGPVISVISHNKSKFHATSPTHLPGFAQGGMKNFSVFSLQIHPSSYNFTVNPEETRRRRRRRQSHTWGKVPKNNGKHINGFPLGPSLPEKKIRKQFHPHRVA